MNATDLMSSELRFEAWEGFEGLHDSLPIWRSVLAQVELDPLCNSPEWVLAYAEAYLRSDDVFGWRVFDHNDEPAAFLAFRLETPRTALSLRRALMLTDGSFDSDYIDLPIRPGLERPVLERCLDALKRRGGVDAMLLAPIPEQSPTLAAIRQLLPQRWLPFRADTVECAAAPLPETFDAYIKGLKSRMRSKVRQAMRAADSANASFHWCDDRSSLTDHLNGLFRLHAMRWQEAGEPGAFADERRCQFYRTLALDAVDNDRLRLSRLDIDGTPVAYQYGIVAGGIYYQMQEGFDTSLAKGRISTALRALSIQALIEEKVHTYDFMAGPSRHKSDWGSQPKNCASIAFALPRVRARISYGARAVIDRWRAARA